MSEEDDLLVPVKYSREAIRALPFAIMQIVVAYKYKYKKMSALAFLLTITSIMHWCRMKRSGWIRKVDIVIALSIIISTTFYDIKRFTPFYQSVWRKTVAIGITGYIMNQILYHYQIQRPVLSDKPYWWGSLHYTLPNTDDRVHAYRRSVLWHNLCLHILFTSSCTTCIIGSARALSRSIKGQ